MERDGCHGHAGHLRLRISVQKRRRMKEALSGPFGRLKTLSPVSKRIRSSPVDQGIIAVSSTMPVRTALSNSGGGEFSVFVDQEFSQQKT